MSICLYESESVPAQVMHLQLFISATPKPGHKTVCSNRLRGQRDISAPPFRLWTARRRAVSAPDISAPFPIFLNFSSYEEKTMK